ncbi:MAG: prepilin-type N-terminal cleavage/methylation domain-containing protein [Rubrivivax sp.]|nr:prepilin-type N-terminal cleavage/methylation domain-containing protein [Rubrivivax sp.]
MPTSVPGSRGQPRRRGRRGFTLIELLIVIAIIAISVGVVSLALRDSQASRLEEEGARLTALLEMARAEARVAGATVHWVPGVDAEGNQFRFVGLTAAQTLPRRWLDPATTAEVVGSAVVVLGPEAILPPQRIVLRLGERRLELGSDGLGPFAVSAQPAADAALR